MLYRLIYDFCEEKEYSFEEYISGGLTVASLKCSNPLWILVELCEYIIEWCGGANLIDMLDTIKTARYDGDLLIFPDVCKAYDKEAV